MCKVNQSGLCWSGQPCGKNVSCLTPSIWTPRPDVTACFYEGPDFTFNLFWDSYKATTMFKGVWINNCNFKTCSVSGTAVCGGCIYLGVGEGSSACLVVPYLISGFGEASAVTLPVSGSIGQGQHWISAVSRHVLSSDKPNARRASSQLNVCKFL